MDMAKLTSGGVKKVAKLAKLSLTAGELKKFQGQLSEVISHIEELKEVDTKDIAPTSQTTGLTNVFRSDEVIIQDCIPVDLALSGTTRKHNGYFVVPAILEK